MENRNHVLLFAPEITPRISYIAGIFFNGKLLLTTSEEEFRLFDGCRINYSHRALGIGIQVIPHGLLEQTNIAVQQTDCFEWEGSKVFFRTGGDIPFDIFSAAFYLLSRYEEYLPHEKDKYGRYAHTNSLAYREDFLRVPLVNIWMLSFYGLITKKYPSFTPPAARFRYIPTYDVDIAFSYRSQSLLKNIFGFYRDLLTGKIEKVIERGNVYSGRKQDPFDTFAWLDTLHAKYKLQPVYFLLTIIKRGEYDKNLPASSKALQRLYNRLASVYVTGLHPSWQSGTDEYLLEQEKETLENIVKHKVFISRNHYLRFRLPHTYRRLLSAGMTDDHSMAYGSVNGFRASFAFPYRWYDLEKETTTHLVIHPFCFMEAAAAFEQGYSAEQAGEELKYFHDTVKNVNGQFITLFHNHFLTEQPEWVAWRTMYERFLLQSFSPSGTEKCPGGTKAY